MQTNRHPFTAENNATTIVLALSVVDFSKAIGVSKGTVYNLMKDGKLKSFTVAGRRLIPASEAHRLVNEAA